MNKTALVIVDMIYDFTNANGKVFYPKNETIIEPLATFIANARRHDCRIIFIEHTVKMEDFLQSKVKMRECCIEGSGGEITDSRLGCDRNNDIIIKKTKYSAFFKTDLDRVLKQHEIQNVLIVGTKTNNCVLATAFDAYSLNFDTYVISDLVGTSDDLTNEIYLRDINKYLAKVIDSKTALSMMVEGVL
ncbi:MAG TPA: isochorismatase family cysteine hydrolase [Bacillota bacterium]|nr:isochorismatase family cysteine hydrolase [Bacillota bacterium]